LSRRCDLVAEPVTAGLGWQPTAATIGLSTGHADERRSLRALPGPFQRTHLDVLVTIAR
jgi:hypothetical protein